MNAPQPTIERLLDDLNFLAGKSAYNASATREHLCAADPHYVLGWLTAERNHMRMEDRIIYTRSLEDEGWLAYYDGTPYGELITDEERDGWRQAQGEHLYHKAMLAAGKRTVSEEEDLPV